MIGYEARFCDYCNSSILGGQRWVREKIYSPQSWSREPAYRYFHVELFDGQETSCWEKHELEQEIDRTALNRENVGQLASDEISCLIASRTIAQTSRPQVTASEAQ